MSMTFELQPTLLGETLEVRPLKRDDFEALFKAASDPLIWEQHPESDRYTRPVFQHYFDSGIASGSAFAVVERATGRIIGSSRYHDYQPDESTVEIGWTFIERAFWGGRTNAELKSLMLEHAFRFVDNVLFVIGKNNVRSRKAVEKLGATLLKTLPRPGSGGVAQNNVIYVLRKPPPKH